MDEKRNLLSPKDPFKSFFPHGNTTSLCLLDRDWKSLVPWSRMVWQHLWRKRSYLRILGANISRCLDNRKHSDKQIRLTWGMEAPCSQGGCGPYRCSGGLLVLTSENCKELHVHCSRNSFELFSWLSKFAPQNRPPPITKINMINMITYVCWSLPSWGLEIGSQGVSGNAQDLSL